MSSWTKPLRIWLSQEWMRICIALATERTLPQQWRFEPASCWGDDQARSVQLEIHWTNRHGQTESWTLWASSFNFSIRSSLDFNPLALMKSSKCRVSCQFKWWASLSITSLWSFKTRWSMFSSSGYPDFSKQTYFFHDWYFWRPEVSPRESRFAANCFGFWDISSIIVLNLRSIWFRHPTGWLVMIFWIAGIPDGRIEGKLLFLQFHWQRYLKSVRLTRTWKVPPWKLHIDIQYVQQFFGRRKCDCVFVIDTIQKCFLCALVPSFWKTSDDRT